MWSHPLWCLDHKNQNPKQYLCLNLHRVLFFSFFFYKLSTWSSCGVVITIITMIITCSITWHVPTSLNLHTLSIEVSIRVSSIIQNQTRAFTFLSLHWYHITKHVREMLIHIITWMRNYLACLILLSSVYGSNYPNGPCFYKYNFEVDSTGLTA